MKETAADAGHRTRVHLWDFLIAVLQLVILVLFLLLLRGCGGGDGPTQVSPASIDRLGCGEGSSRSYVMSRLCWVDPSCPPGALPQRVRLVIPNLDRGALANGPRRARGYPFSASWNAPTTVST